MRSESGMSMESICALFRFETLAASPAARFARCPLCPLPALPAPAAARCRPPAAVDARRSSLL